MDDDLNVKLTDFGLSMSFSLAENTDPLVDMDMHELELYAPILAPEVGGVLPL